MSGPSVLDSLSSTGSGNALSSLSPLIQGRLSGEVRQSSSEERRRKKGEVEVEVEVHDYSSGGSSPKVKVRSLSPAVEAYELPQKRLQGQVQVEEEESWS